MGAAARRDTPRARTPSELLGESAQDRRRAFVTRGSLERRRGGTQHPSCGSCTPPRSVWAAERAPAPRECVSAGAMDRAARQLRSRPASDSPDHPQQCLPLLRPLRPRRLRHELSLRLQRSRQRGRAAHRASWLGPTPSHSAKPRGQKGGERVHRPGERARRSESSPEIASR